MRRAFTVPALLFPLILAHTAVAQGASPSSPVGRAAPERWEAPAELIPLKFREFGCELPADDRRFMAEFIVKLADFYRPPETNRDRAFLVVELYGTQEAYETALSNKGIRPPARTTALGAPADSPALYVPALQLAVVPKFGWEIRSIMHELAHHVHRWAMPRTETWLNEGCSTFFEDTLPDPEELRVSAPAAKTRIVERIFRFRLLEVGRLLSMEPRAFNTGTTEAVGYRYELSWAIVNHLFQ